MIFLIFSIVIVVHTEGEVKEKTVLKLIEENEKKLPQIKKDSANIVFFFKNKGYLDVKCRYEIKNDTVFFYITEGKRYFIKNIDIPQEFIEVKRKYQQRPFERRYVEDIKNYILDKLYNQGYFYAQVYIKKDIAQKGEVNLFIEIEKGKKVFIKDVIFLGAKGVSVSYLKRVVYVKPGDIYSKRDIEKSRRELYNTKLFRFVDTKFRGSESKKDSIECVFLLKKRKEKAFSVGFGFEIPYRLLFNAGFVHRNILRRAILLSLNAGYLPSFKGDYELSLNLENVYPKVTSLKFDFYVNPFWSFKKEVPYFYYEFGGEAGQKVTIFNNIRLSNFIKYKKLSYIKGKPHDKIDIVNLFDTGITYDSRNNFFHPSDGYYLFFYTDIAGGFLGGEYDFLRCFIDARKYKELPFNEIVSAVRIRIGYMHPYGRSDSLPVFEEFTLGGVYNLRGYMERSIGPDEFGNYKYGSFLLNFNLELRTGYWNNFGLVVFLDGGNLSKGIQDIYMNWGIGIGVRYNLPIGPVRIDYGKALGKSWEEDKGRLHLALLEMF